ncbi:hypothetical protein [Virgibacillus sp. SK37]|uniref:hypothetical protein n=1 Tax=Virgibacillus sp. SK37 TaxID=403957 RepID=UPI0004D188C8|nr:hypothetical protein [Virgibacillus sp. SK37]AIF45283.1 hypothetical protein X953_06490 [Virgibacillus sp. SK37]
MGKRQIISIVSLIISGILALFASLFLASGTIAENYTDKTFVAPEFFIILAIWGIGVVFFFVQQFKAHTVFFVLSLVFMWLSVPIGFRIGIYCALKAKGEI